MRRPRTFLNTILGVVIAAGCANEATSPNPLPQAAVVAAPRDILACTAFGSATASARIGMTGGTLSVGPHTLVVPRGAIKGQPVTITATTGWENGNAIQFGPAGLVFEKPAVLTMSVANCSGWAAVARFFIAYTDDNLNPLELYNATVNNQARTVTSQIYHFSRYAVAY